MTGALAPPKSARSAYLEEGLDACRALSRLCVWFDVVGVSSGFVVYSSQGRETWGWQRTILGELCEQPFFIFRLHLQLKGGMGGVGVEPSNT